MIFRIKYKSIKNLSVFLIALLLGLSSFAQTNEGIEAIYSEMYPTAKIIFSKQLADSLTKPEACYYLGETYRLSGNADSAAFYFELGAAGENPNSLCLVGKAGLIMVKDPTLSSELIKKARWVKEYYKNPALYVALSKVYAENKNFEKAFEMLNHAKDVDEKYAYIYLTEGNILLQQNKPSEAAGKYETAIYYNAECKSAFLKLALIYYKTRNYEMSLKYIGSIKLIDPHFPPSIKLFGDISYEQGKYSDAVTAYAEYLQRPEVVIGDHIRYAYSLFFNKEYQQSLDQINQLIPYYPKNQVLKRLQAYSSYEVGNYTEGLSLMQAFLNSVDQSTIITSDYKYYARLLYKNDQDSLSIVNFQKAIVSGASPQEFYKEMAFCYEKMGKFREAASCFELFIKAAKTPGSSDFFYWGRDCYFAAGAIDSVTIEKDSTRANMRIALYYKADSLFSEMVLLSPENYLGYLWRARVNALLDPETESGLAKPFYEKVVALLEQKSESNKKELIESYQYLGYHYYIGNEFQKSKMFWNKGNRGDEII
jgi:predicted negative regulator of RcsB-dependent stress response